MKRAIAYLPLVFVTAILNASDGQPSSFFLQERVVVRLHPDKNSTAQFKPQPFTFQMPLHQRKLTLVTTPTEMVANLATEISKLQLKYKDVNRKEVCVEKELDFFTAIDQAHLHGFHLEDTYEPNTPLEEVRQELEKDKQDNLVLEAYINSPKNETAAKEDAAAATAQEETQTPCEKDSSPSGCWKALAKFSTLVRKKLY